MSFFFFVVFFFFFSSRRRHTRSTHDWSSDVCSSDLSSVSRSLSCVWRSRSAFSRASPTCDATPSIRRSSAGVKLRAEAHQTRKRPPTTRSEERRVGKECRYRWSPSHQKKNKTKKQ